MRMRRGGKGSLRGTNARGCSFFASPKKEPKKEPDNQSQGDCRWLPMELGCCCCAGLQFPDGFVRNAPSVP